MPELPEVETVRRGLAPVLVGRRLIDVGVLRPDLRWPLPTDFAGRLRGRRVRAIDRRGKFLLIRLDDDTVLLAHLGMSGRFRVCTGVVPPPGVHEHVVFTTDAGVSIRFHDPRRFGFLDIVDAAVLAEHAMLAKLGPEPLDRRFTGESLAAALSGRSLPIKVALLDQTIVAGIGNIYACESLFRSRIDPTRPASEVDIRQVRRLVTAIRTVLKEAIAAGGATLRDHRAPSGELGTFQHGFAVYGRAGEGCPGCTCKPDRSGGILRITQSGRSTFYCAKRQR